MRWGNMGWGFSLYFSFLGGMLLLYVDEVRANGFSFVAYCFLGFGFLSLWASVLICRELHNEVRLYRRFLENEYGQDPCDSRTTLYKAIRDNSPS